MERKNKKVRQKKGRMKEQKRKIKGRMVGRKNGKEG